MTGKTILALNAGSSSLKYALFEANSLRGVVSARVERVGTDVPDHVAALEAVVNALAPYGGLARVSSIGHRIVHGGEAFLQPTVVTNQVLRELGRLSELDPDHLPAEIAIVEACLARVPSVPQVACFDTTFHDAMPRVARMLPIPRRFETRGIRRFGFHGLSYQFLSEELARRAGEHVAHGRVVLAHLGSGASLAAMRAGRCIDTTMAFTPNSGISMGTRSGDLDPGVVFRILRSEGMTADSLDDVLNHRSGLLGVSETSSDMRDLLARESSDGRAAEAVALFCYQARKAIGALAAALGGLDVLVFAGGIGENAPVVRERIVSGLEHLGIRLDVSHNERSLPLVSHDSSACAVWVLRTDEEAIIARETLRLIGG